MKWSRPLLLFMIVAFETPTLDATDKSALYSEGTMRDANGQVWSIQYLPGSRNITNSAVDAFSSAGDHMGNLVSADFYNDWVWSPFEFGIEFAFISSVADYWLAGSLDDLGLMFELWGEDDTFGGFLGKIIGTAWFTGTIGFRTITFPIGTAFGLSIAAAVPPLAIVFQPAAAIFYTAVPGVTLPIILYTWNGTMFLPTLLMDPPERESMLASRRLPADKRKVFSKEMLEFIINGSINRVEIEEKNEEINAQITKLEKQIHELRKRIDDNESDPKFYSYRELIYEAEFRDYEVAQDVEELLQEKSLATLVRQRYLELDPQASEADIARAREIAKETMDSIQD